MPTTLDATGLSIASVQELVTQLITGYQSIYGADINFDSNTQDGQTINLQAQMTEDLLEVLLSVYNAFDPQAAIGTQQDRLYYINGLIRQAASFSYQDVQITVTQSLTLQGLDAAANDPNGTGYTVSDNADNQWILLDTQNPSVAGTYTYTFRAQNLGSLTSTPNTITIPVTVVLGVSAINNSTGVTSVGLNGETDAAFRTRQAVSYAIKSANSADGLYGALLNLTGVVYAAVYVNDTNSTDGNGIPAHGSWTVVEGGADSDIANLIYAYTTPGTPTKGSTSYDVTTIQGQTYVANFDRPTAIPLYVKFNIQALQSGQSFNTTAIANYIVANQTYGIGEEANTSTLTYQAMNAITNVSGGLGVPLSLLISSDNSTWVSYLTTPTLADQWNLSAINIAITVL